MTPDLESAQAAFAGFLHGLDRRERILIFHDSDADGVTSGVVLEAALRRLQYQELHRRAPNRERDAWSDSNRALIRDARPDAVFLLDLGARHEPLVENARCCIVDHHRPDGTPPGALLITSYTWDPIPNTSMLVYDLCAPLVDITDLDWIAAVGVLSDVGERAPFPLMAQVRAKYSISHLKEVTALVNAARRASDSQPENAARALLSHSSPQQFITSDTPDLRALHDARAEFQSALAEAKRAAPKFAGDVALIRVHSRCQVHPVIAQIWRTRLPKLS